MAKRTQYVKFFTTGREEGIKGQQVIPDNISVDGPVTYVPFWFSHNFSCLVYRFLGMYLEGVNHRIIHCNIPHDGLTLIIQ